MNQETANQAIAHLLETMEGRFLLREETLSLGGQQLSCWVAENIDELLEELLAKGEDHEDVRDERIPYYAELWPSAICLADQLLRHPEWVAGREVLELGCGLGLAGTAAKLAGATKVLLTDYLEDALRFASLVWWRNVGSAPETKVLDWRFPEASQPRPVLIAADVVYEKRHFIPLIHAFKTLLPPDGDLYLTEPSRVIAQDFFEMIQAAGMRYAKEEHVISYRHLRHRIQFYHIRW